MIYILLGMHKSGTTLLSQILHESGIHMGRLDETKGYDDGNKFEFPETHDLNIEVLGTEYNEHSLNVTRCATSAPPAILDKMRKFAAETSVEFRDWGFKDPRTCLTYSIWKEVIPDHRLVGIFRHPAELWSHYRRQKGSALNFFPMLWKSTTAWYIYNRELLNVVKTRGKDYFLAEYNDFMTTPGALTKLSTYVGRPLNDSRNPSLYRSKKNDDRLFLAMLAVQKNLFSRDLLGLYAELRALAS